MTVGELIKILREYDRHLPVQHFSDEEGNRISNAAKSTTETRYKSYPGETAELYWQAYLRGFE